MNFQIHRPRLSHFHVAEGYKSVPSNINELQYVRFCPRDMNTTCGASRFSFRSRSPICSSPRTSRSRSRCATPAHEGERFACIQAALASASSRVRP
jgi:hypothetical protein